MSTIQQSIEIDVPLRTAYDQWTQFEQFPQFMEGVEQVEQVDDKRLHWKASIGGVEREWMAEIVDQTPDQSIAWRSTSGSRNDGVVTFAPGTKAQTCVTVRIDFEPEGVVEKAGDALNLVERRVAGDLARFKDLIEGQGFASGAWRGEIKPTGEVTTRH